MLTPLDSQSSPSVLVDPFGREINYLRLSVTDRCNLRCQYCMAEDMAFLPRAKVLTLEEIRDIATAFVELGVRKIRLTGGEPLVRHGILQLVQWLSKIPQLRELVMTTNGILLPQVANALKDAGVQRLNISLDSLQPQRFRDITRFGELAEVKAGIAAAQSAGYKCIKLNAVILQGVNDDEVVELARFAVDGGMDISFIEEMPLGEISSHERRDTQCASRTIRERLEQQFSLVDSAETTGGPSRYVKVVGTASRIGFISPMTNNFCASCNRVRLTAEGRLLLCLGNEHSLDLRDLVRRHPGDTELLKKNIVAAIGRKPERHHFDPQRTEIVRFMSMTGG